MEWLKLQGQVHLDITIISMRDNLLNQLDYTVSYDLLTVYMLL